MNEQIVKLGLAAYESWMQSFRAPKGWMDTQENREKLAPTLLEHVENTGTADARDVDDVYKQLVTDGVEFDINWSILIPHLDTLGLKSIEEAARYTKDNGHRLSTNPSLLAKLN